MWIEPKTNWTREDVPLPEDFNRIEGNIRELQSKPGKPVARVRLSSALNLTASTITKIPFDVVDINVGGYYDKANRQFLPPAGYYRVSISLHAFLLQDSALSTITLYLYRGGIPYNHSYQRIINIDILAALDNQHVLTDVVYANGSQALDLRVVSDPLAAKIDYCFAAFEKI